VSEERFCVGVPPEEKETSMGLPPTINVFSDSFQIRYVPLDPSILFGEEEKPK